MSPTSTPVTDARVTDTLVYDVDLSDCIIAVNDAWSAFAIANDAAELAAPAVLGLHLWDAVGDPTTRELYRVLLVRVREGRLIDYAYRCDAPSVRREMAMHVALAGRMVRFTSSINAATPRDTQRLLDRATIRTDDILRACGWCNRIAVTADRWEEVEVAVVELALFEHAALPRLSHGICPPCQERVAGEFAA